MHSILCRPAVTHCWQVSKGAVRQEKRTEDAERKDLEIYPIPGIPDTGICSLREIDQGESSLCIKCEPHLDHALTKRAAFELDLYIVCISASLNRKVTDLSSVWIFLKVFR